MLTRTSAKSATHHARVLVVSPCQQPPFVPASSTRLAVTTTASMRFARNKSVLGCAAEVDRAVQSDVPQKMRPGIGFRARIVRSASVLPVLPRGAARIVCLTRVKPVSSNPRTACRAAGVRSRRLCHEISSDP